jgi:glyoxylase-like metal-dependent hydrolase (beta-lactamase superfamily II)
MKFTSPEVTVLIPGYAVPGSKGRQHCSGTITLVRGAVNAVVDTGLPVQKRQIVRQLARNGLKPADIHYVILTHGHSDHVGNNNLFPDATFVLDSDVSKGDEFSVHSFRNGAMSLARGIDVIATPGHTDHDLSVVVKTAAGTVIIVGDLFEHSTDGQDRAWEAWSRDLERQRDSRERVLRMADFIVPGHGCQFPVTHSPKKRRGSTRPS